MVSVCNVCVDWYAYRALAKAQEIGQRFAGFCEKTEDSIVLFFSMEHLRKWLPLEHQIGRCETISGRPLLPTLPVAKAWFSSFICWCHKISFKEWIYWVLPFDKNYQNLFLVKCMFVFSNIQNEFPSSKNRSVTSAIRNHIKHFMCPSMNWPSLYIWNVW